MSVHETTVVCGVCVLIYKHQILTVCLFANFVFLDCTISHFGLHKLHLGLDCTNLLDCTLKTSPEAGRVR